MKGVLKPQGATSLNGVDKNYYSVLSCEYFVGFMITLIEIVK